MKHNRSRGFARLGLWALLLAACGGTNPDVDASSMTANDAAGVDSSVVVDASTSDVLVEASAPPTGPGPFGVKRSSMALGDTTVNVFDPQMPPNTRAPLVMFKHGFQLSTQNYATTLERIASHGYVVIGVDSMGSIFNGPTQAQERDGVIAALDWATSNQAPFAAHLDAAHVAALGHSRGGKIALMVAAKDTRVRAMLGFDPVNGCGPNQPYSPDCPDVSSGAFAPGLSIPLGYMGETIDAQGIMACAPAPQNYASLYSASTKASWRAQWTFPNAAHMTFTDDGGGVFGSFCMKASGNEATMREEIRTLAVAFLRRHLRNDASMDAWLTGASVPKDIVVTH